MRLGVLDVGSNTVHLLVVDAHHGAAPRSAYSFKAELKLAELLEADGRIAPDGAHRLGEVVTQAHSVADDKGCEEVVAFATSALREAPNGDEVIADVAARSGVALAVLTGSDEARLTFLAVRRWFGWSSGRLLVLDIGGGSLEIAGGIDEDPDVAVSLPLGAGRLTRDWFSADPPPDAEVSALRRHVRTEVARQVGGVLRTGEPSRYVATSKTFKQLARLSGAPSSAEGPYVERFLDHAALQDWLPRLARLSSQQRTELPGVSPARARQLLAGAIVADAAMDLLGAKRLQICPWALREGVILRRLDMMDR